MPTCPTAISMALKDNMLGGCPDDTLNLIGEMKTLNGVKELAVMKSDGSYAFGLRGPQLRLDSALLAKLINGESIALSQSGCSYFLKPLLTAIAAGDVTPHRTGYGVLSW